MTHTCSSSLSFSPIHPFCPPAGYVEELLAPTSEMEFQVIHGIIKKNDIYI